jgi:hypothetical protein
MTLENNQNITSIDKHITNKVGIPKVKEEKFTVYKCPKCKIFNKFGEGKHCQNYFTKPQICKFDIEKAYDDEANQLIFDELTEH